VDCRSETIPGISISSSSITASSLPPGGANLTGSNPWLKMRLKVRLEGVRSNRTLIGTCGGRRPGRSKADANRRGRFVEPWVRSPASAPVWELTEPEYRPPITSWFVRESAA